MLPDAGMKDVVMENVGSSPSLSAQHSEMGQLQEQEQETAEIEPPLNRKRKRAEIAASELGSRQRKRGAMLHHFTTIHTLSPSHHVAFDLKLRDLGLLPNSGRNSPSQSRNGSRATSPAAGLGGSKQSNSSHIKASTSAKKSTRNVDRVFFGSYDIKTWYYSPYPLEEDDWDSANTPSHGDQNQGHPRKPSGRWPDGSKSKKDPQLDPSSNPTADSSMNPQVNSSNSASLAVQNGAADSTKAGDTNNSSSAAEAPPTSSRKMWVCDGCFKYMRSYPGWTAHKKECAFRSPPGRKVYQRGAHIIWEVDGAQAKLYAQNLSLFGKLFIDHKTIYFDVEPFTFYVLTDATTQFDHALGYFSKEKVSYDDYNLACIITFPPFQQKGFGTLLIEFSYYLSSLTQIPGTPERPLSDLGLKGYLSFWSSVVLRTLALAFNDTEAPVISLPYIGNKLQSPSAPASIQRMKLASLRVRKILLGLPLNENESGINRIRSLDSSNDDGTMDGVEDPKEKEKRKRSSLGWAGEIRRPSNSSSITLESGPSPIGNGSGSNLDTPEGSSTEGRRTLRLRLDKGKEKASSLTPPPASPRNTHPLLLNLDHQNSNSFELRTSLERIAEAANLRMEDCALALNECGLLSWRVGSSDQEPNGNGNGSSGGNSNRKGSGNVDISLMISLEKVREELQRRGVKRQMLDENYVLY